MSYLKLTYLKPFPLIVFCYHFRNLRCTFIRKVTTYNQNHIKKFHLKGLFCICRSVECALKQPMKVELNINFFQQQDSLECLSRYRSSWYLAYISALEEPSACPCSNIFKQCRKPVTNTFYNDFTFPLKMGVNLSPETHN